MFEDERSRHNCRKLWMRVAGELFALCHCLHCLTMWSAFYRQTTDNHTWLLYNPIENIIIFGGHKCLKQCLWAKNLQIHCISIERKQKTAFYWEKLPKKSSITKPDNQFRYSTVSSANRYICIYLRSESMNWFQIIISWCVFLAEKQHMTLVSGAELKIATKIISFITQWNASILLERPK